MYVMYTCCMQLVGYQDALQNSQQTLPCMFVCLYFVPIVSKTLVKLCRRSNIKLQKAPSSKFSYPVEETPTNFDQLLRQLLPNTEELELEH